MRAFIGIGLPSSCRRAIADAVSPLREKRASVSWTQEQNLHITLKFLGEIPPGRVDEIASLLANAAAGFSPFRFSVEEAGGFPNLRAPRVLWIGIREPLELVGKLQENIENALSAAGFPREGKRFHPHVTVGRVRDRVPPGWGDGFAKAVSGKAFGGVDVRSFQLYESRLSPGGAIYHVLRDVPLHQGTEKTGREEKVR